MGRRWPAVMSDLEDFDPDAGISDDDEQPDEEHDVGRMGQPYRIGDPVVDLAQGRPMVVLAAPDQTVAEWSDAEGYDLMGNYANSKFDPMPNETVVECVYVSDVRSEPSKTYTFPISRVALIDAHHADDGRRLADRVAVDLLESLFGAALDVEHTPSVDAVAALVAEAGIDEELQRVACETAKAARGEVMADE